MTKRFLAIIILGLLLSSNAFSKILPNDSPEEQYKEWREDIKKHPEKIIRMT